MTETLKSPDAGLVAEVRRWRELLRKLERAVSLYQALRTTNNGSATASMEITDARLALDKTIMEVRDALSAAPSPPPDSPEGGQGS
jgi:hypothetical protein